MEPKKSDELRRGVIVFIVLAVLTAIEYLVATQHLPAVILWVIALMKGGTVLWYFMHVFRVFRSDEGGH
jgi:cytochrome c oxidase subunit 4